MHSFPLSYGAERVAAASNEWVLYPLVSLILPAFFSLSGFLVAGSLLRHRSILTFLAFRALRIYPALGVEVLLSALVLGPLLTTADFAAYVSHPDFASYFLNMVGNIHYFLPGMFEDNPYPSVVNGSLWTVPIELQAYGWLFVLGILGIARHRFALLCCMFALAIGASDLMREPAHYLILYFFSGVALYLWREHMPYHIGFFVLCAISALSLYGLTRQPQLLFLPIAYMVVYLGLTQPKRIPFLLRGDYSYGIYLYAFPVQQVVALLLPDHRFWYVNAMIALPVTFLLAAFSWHCIERPALRLKAYVKTNTPKAQHELQSAWVGNGGPGRI